jgi:pyrroloquinoline quinone biosynthesis protein D
MNDERRGAAPKLARRARLRFDRHEGCSMLIYPERGLMLNESAAAIARMCDGTRSVAAIVAALAETHDGARESIERDVFEFLGSLRSKGLLE